MRPAGGGAGTLKQGAIVWATVPDPHGNPKRRPLVILTRTDEILLDSTIVGVAVTTTYPNPPTPEYVELPWYRAGHPVTGLAKRSAAACHWLVPLRASDVETICGRVPTIKMIEIVERVAQLKRPPGQFGP